MFVKCFEKKIGSFDAAGAVLSLFLQFAFGVASSKRLKRLGDKVGKIFADAFDAGAARA